MKLTYYGHSCFLLEVADKKVLFDPFITPNELAKDIDVDSIECDYILVSHGHEDHLADLVRIGKRTGATVVSNYEIVNWAAKQGLDKGHPMNTGGTWNFDFGRVRLCNAVHSSSFPDGSYAGLAGGFVIEAEAGTLYYAGDTALTTDMRLLTQQHNIDYALLPIGDNFTMGIDDAIQASNYINCGNVVGMHYDTFPPIKINHHEARGKFAAAGATLHLMEIGSSMPLFEQEHDEELRMGGVVQELVSEAQDAVNGEVKPAAEDKAEQ